jgi:hypothetical protein
MALSAERKRETEQYTQQENTCSFKEDAQIGLFHGYRMFLFVTKDTNPEDKTENLPSHPPAFNGN